MVTPRTTGATQPTAQPSPDLPHAAFPWLPLSAATVLGLQGYRAYPSVSLLLSTRPGPQLDPADRARLETLARQARRRLVTEGVSGGNALAEALARIASTMSGQVDRALALFASPGRTARVDLPVEVVDRCVIDPTFATRDLVRAMHRTPRHVVLLLAADQARLLDGVGGSLVEVTAGFPRVDPDHRPGTPARTRFLRAVDDALGAYRRLHPAPLVLAAAQPTLSGFRKASRHCSRLAGTVAGNHLNTPHAELRGVVRGVIGKYLRSRQDEALALLAACADEGRVVHGIDATWLAARWERPEMLAVEEGFFHPARISADGDTLVAADDPEEPDVCDDAVDELIETVLSRGGWVAMLADGTLPRGARVALAVRQR